MTGPTVLTILRMLLSVAFVVFALLPEMWARITALVIFILASVFIICYVDRWKLTGGFRGE